jgi:hypothetical protein
LEGGACGENILGRGKIKDFSWGKIVGVNDFGKKALVVGSEVFSDGRGNNGSKKDVFLRSESDGVVDGDVLIFDPKASGFEGQKFNLGGDAPGKNGASESFWPEVTLNELSHLTTSLSNERDYVNIAMRMLCHHSEKS